ncbi:DUF4232 domain-containing protein [Streptomyces sp. NBC_01498]|uniref:DUF4232 domain-containing protein n=1 Tax=Streptomyces sp. NBC_01498 TaxID=2975870 RepID=UPI002E7BA85C|nr:DUF4232 domain-containing protein [Streptomyces sp. NBC_01498]WTL25507.1 DUF4232 domain-containing protein [Streptomyces sp. NBC_01498]
MLLGLGGPGGGGGGGDGLADEQALRLLLHGAVQEIKPSTGALDHLRRAVPARRARKRQALVGVAAAALLMGTAVPAFVHVASTGGTSDDTSFNVGHGEQVQGGTGSDSGPTGDDGGGASPSDTTDNGQGGVADENTPEAGVGKGTGGTSGGLGGDPQSSSTQAAAVCQAAQLVVSSAESGEPQANGTVYGRFRISNNSGSDCAVSGHGSVDFLAVGAADPTKIEVLNHTSGDPATGLPDPSLETESLVLPPSGSYEVMFAWVPTDTCPTDEPSPNPTPTEGEPGGVTKGPESSPEETAPQLGRDDGPEDGSIEVVHVPESGSTESATTTIDDACAGTIYRTGVLEAT